LDRDGVQAWLSRWGFAALVCVAVVVSLVIGVTVDIPADIPSVALRAPALYRLEVGGAIFVGLYVVAMAVVLALQNRAFTEIGTGGVKAHDLSGVPETMWAQERTLKLLSAAVDELRDLRERD